jgi:hypothetical protein
MCLNSYNLASIQLADILHIKRLINLSYLEISFSFGQEYMKYIRDIMVGSLMFEHIHSKMSSYKVTFDTVEGDET